MLQDVAATIKDTHSFHLSGALSTGGTSPVSLDLQIARPDTVAGSLTIMGATAQLVLANGDAFLQGRTFIQLLAGQQVAATVGDQWVRLPAASVTGLQRGFELIADTSRFGGCLVSSGKKTSLRQSATTINGASVIEIKGGDGTLDVLNASKPFPVRFGINGTSGLGSGTAACSPSGSTSGSSVNTVGVLKFDHWGSSFTVTPPANYLDLSTAG